MNVCVKCGCEADRTMRFCPHCGVGITPEGLADPAAGADEARALRFDRLYDPDFVQPAKVSAVAAGVLSLLVPGLGQVFIGQWRKGCEIFAGLVLAALFPAAGFFAVTFLRLGNKAILADMLWLGSFSLLLPLLALYGIVAADAIMLARKLGRAAVGKQEWWFSPKTPR